MSQLTDLWYIRLPGGEILRASSTEAVRRHLASGQLPLDSRVRRSPDEEWVALEWTEEFADVVVRGRDGRPGAAAEKPPSGPPPAPAAPPPPPATRVDPMRLQTVGVRGLVEELLAAMDTAMMRNKIIVGCVAGGLGGLAVGVAGLMNAYRTQRPSVLPWAGAALALMAIFAVANAVLTQATYLELARLRPARWDEMSAGWPRFAFRLLVAYVVTSGLPLVGIQAARRLPEWVAPLGEPAWLAGVGVSLADAMAGAALVIEIALWPLLSLPLLLAPVVVVENSSARAALRRWWHLLRQDVGRVFIYEALATALGTVAAVPFFIPLALAALGRIRGGGLDIAAQFWLYLIAWVAVAPLWVYLAVANVFVYLNLRYEFPPRRSSAG